MLSVKAYEASVVYCSLYTKWIFRKVIYIKQYSEGDEHSHLICHSLQMVCAFTELLVSETVAM